MTDRERLIELIAATKYCPSSETDEFYLCNECPYGKEDNCREAYIADYLISHGVTVQKHGRWVAIPSSDMVTGKAFECSGCKKMRFGSFKPNYCPNCGAKMDGEA